ncbi:SixA phosphatase family protein [Mucilaginibacter phyllosphaerae]|uniref:Histidine phosphatase family protein n=1 Tax=Mucilaginibacter phyllosphaerae TaxID=1812349 RepID=A0A4Y8A9Z8_9SPHI|nr:histidine phosphatase family protein [Mucilaginibacter phyllosphaerae]MBB3970626.1 phosphohistidine phosphatase [Mucilaginibacter phyllosphaerae]TEW64633.1 histidine phosphatase family protein [Mucilaginibacter phyllosphaerae]GGH19929.1 phosphohistidine phosphatase SixA [Mucilaginibacter phyllosphaerae]
MKKLLLIRHAKATHETGFTDFERPLTHKGLKQAETIATRILANNLKPQLLVASPALRTLSTANVFSQVLGLQQAVTDKAIYDASESTLLKVIDNLPQDKDFIALVGHNPGISQVLYYLSGAIKDVPPCAVALIEFELDTWAEIFEQTGKLTFYDTPSPL